MLGVDSHIVTRNNESVSTSEEDMLGYPKIKVYHKLKSLN
jgi:hypothetical protein